MKHWDEADKIDDDGAQANRRRTTVRMAILERKRGNRVTTIVAPPQTTPPANPGWIPSPLYRMTVEQYEAMVESGAFKSRDRLHLVNGYLVAKMTQNPPHVVADELCGNALLRLIPTGWHLLAAKPIRLRERQSEPEPDRCIVRGAIRDYEDRHPGPEDVAMVIEVADSSLAEDREMGAAVYGPLGIPVNWIVNLVDRQLEVYTDPGPEGYRSREDFRVGQAVPVVVDGQKRGEVAVNDFLPSRPAKP
jgi:Uma2 family endonuclease